MTLTPRSIRLFLIAVVTVAVAAVVLSQTGNGPSGVFAAAGADDQADDQADDSPSPSDAASTPYDDATPDDGSTTPDDDPTPDDRSTSPDDDATPYDDPTPGDGSTTPDDDPTPDDSPSPSDSASPAVQNVGPATFSAADAGTVTYRVVDGSFELLDVSEADGWTVKIEQSGGSEIDLDFFKGTVRVQVDVEFEDGGIRERVRVRDDADDD